MTAKRSTRLSKATLTVALCFLLCACQDRQTVLREQSLAFVTDWFERSARGVTDDAMCHGLGLLKHPEISCAQMAEHAARIDPASRRITVLRQHECFAGVCGVFVELGFTSRDRAGNEVQETALLKHDPGGLQMYWYRSDSLLALLKKHENGASGNDKDPLHLAYDEITARYPGLYIYPPCYDIRPSSKTLAGELMAKDDIDVERIHALADTCGGAFCFGLVGDKIAPLCPAPGG